ncbi:nucleotidyltransferase domain-containing protein [Deferrisoma palaeochoriense]
MHPSVRRGYLPLVNELRRRFGPRLRCVVLFGSRARGDASRLSDHDILVVAEGLPPDPLARQRELASAQLAVLREVPGRLGFVAKTPEEFERSLTPLLLDVCADGVCLYGADYFEPWRERAARAIERSGLRRERVGATLMWLFPKPPPKDWELSWRGYREIA